MSENFENTDNLENSNSSENTENNENSDMSNNYEHLESSDNSEDGFTPGSAEATLAGEGAATAATAAAAETATLSGVARLLAVFTAPGRLAAALKAKPSFVLPLVISTLVALLYTWVSLPAIRQMMLADPQMAQIPPEQLETVFKIQGITTLVGGALGTLIAALVGAVVLHLVAKLLKGQGRYVNALAVIAYSTLIGSLGAVVRLAMYLAIPGADFMRMQTSLAVVMPDAALTDPLYLLLAQLDLFSLWSLVFTAIAFSVCYGLSKSKGALVAFLPWGLYVAATTLITALVA